MPGDSIVEEIRVIREAIAEEHGQDVKAIVEALRRQEATSDVALVSLPPKRLSSKQARRRVG